MWYNSPPGFSVHVQFHSKVIHTLYRELHTTIGLVSPEHKWSFKSLSDSPSFSRSRKDSLESESSAAIIPHELVRTRQLESVHLKFNQESGTLLPLCLRYTHTHTGVGGEPGSSHIHTDYIKQDQGHLSPLCMKAGEIGSGV